MKTIQDHLTYKRHQVQECQRYADFDMILELFSNIPSKDKENMVSDLVEVIAKHDWLEPLFDTIQENHAADFDPEEDAAELMQEQEREDRAIVRGAL